ncbi:MAG: type VI secretion system tip protein VgrG, partial [Bacteroidota bacterium]
QAGNAATFLPGQEIVIKAGYSSQEKEVFQGLIIRFGLQSDQQGSFLIIECKHPAVKLTIGRKNEIFNDKKDSEVINSILQNAGLSKDVESTDNKHPELVQHYVSDWDFILMRADLNGLVVLPEIDKIAIKKPKLDVSPAYEAVYGSSILRFEADIDARNQLNSVLGFSWDAANQELVEAKGNPKGENHPGNLKAKDLAKVIDLKEFNYQTAANIPMAVLDTISTARLTKSQLSFMRGKMTIQGEPDIHPGQLIKISGFSDRFNGNAFIGGIIHTINSESWETDCLLGLDIDWYAEITPGITPFPTSGMTAPISGLSTGLVKQIHEDPDGNYRVQVSIPTLKKDNLILWARLSSLFASKDIGAFFYPEVNDEVVLGFLNEDPHHPIILGMLYSKQKKPPLEPADGNHEKA